VPAGCGAEARRFRRGVVPLARQTRTCPECGVAFTPTVPRQKLCGSKRCRAAYITDWLRRERGAKPHTVTCDVCSCEFETTGGRTLRCSRECKRIGQKRIARERARRAKEARCSVAA
jgi:hypothetical protein